MSRAGGRRCAAYPTKSIKETLLLEGYEPIGDTPEQFAALIKAEVARYAKLIRTTGIQAH